MNKVEIVALVLFGVAGVSLSLLWSLHRTETVLAAVVLTVLLCLKYATYRKVRE